MTREVHSLAELEKKKKLLAEKQYKVAHSMLSLMEGYNTTFKHLDRDQTLKNAIWNLIQTYQSNRSGRN